MGEANYIEAPIRDKNTITVPKKIRDMLGVEEGDTLAFKKEKKQIIVGVIKRTVIEEKIKFTVDWILIEVYRISHVLDTIGS